MFGLVWAAVLTPACDESIESERTETEARMIALSERNCRLECDRSELCQRDSITEMYESLDRCYDLCDVENWTEREYRFCEEDFEWSGYSSEVECRTAAGIRIEGQKSLAGCRAACEAREEESREADSCLQTCALTFTETCADAYSDLLDCREEEPDCSVLGSMIEKRCEEAGIDYRASCGISRY